MQAMLVVASYVAAQMLADIGSLKIVLFAGLSMDAGTFIYPITFTLRDMVHKVAGVKVARGLIVAAAVINLFMAGFFWIAGRLPADPGAGVQADFAAVLSPVWRITLASIVAEVISEMLDTEAYRLWTERVTTKYQWARVLISNTVSVPIDSLAFCWLAFGGVLPVAIVWSIFAANVLLKGITTVLGLPLIYIVRERSERASHTT